MAPSIWQILIIAVVALLLFGGRRIPQIMEDLGKGIQSFKRGIKDEGTSSDVAEKKETTKTVTKKKKA